MPTRRQPAALRAMRCGVSHLRRVMKTKIGIQEPKANDRLSVLDETNDEQ